MNLNAVINKCLNMSFYDLQDFAGENYKKMYLYITETETGETANDILIGTIFTCVAADGSLSDREWDFINSFIGGYTYDEAFDVAGQFYNGDAQETTRKLLSVLPYGIREAYVSLCIAVLCVDKRYKDEEFMFLETILDA